MLKNTPETIIAINKELGYQARNPSVVYSAFSSIPYIDNHLDKVCSVYFGIVNNHPFSDGNKRTATVFLIIELEGYLSPDNTEDLFDLALSTASEFSSWKSVSSFIRNTLNIK